MEIGQSTINSAYTRPGSDQQERTTTIRQENLQSDQAERTEPTSRPARPTTSSGPVGGNIDTYA